MTFLKGTIINVLIFPKPTCSENSFVLSSCDLFEFECLCVCIDKQEEVKSINTNYNTLTII